MCLDGCGLASPSSGITPDPGPPDADNVHLAVRNLLVCALVGGEGLTRVALVLALVTGCGVSNPPKLSPNHIDGDGAASRDHPSSAETMPAHPLWSGRATPPADPRPVETYTVIVNQVPLHDLLFALARDARVDVSIGGGIEGPVTLNAIDLTLEQILERIAGQVAIRYRFDARGLTITADTPYLRTYAVDYLNMERSSTSRIELSTQVGTVGTGASGAPGSGASPTTGGSDSKTRVDNESANAFWDTLIINVAAIVGMEDLSQSHLEQGGNSTLIVNRETGLLSVVATGRQHTEVQRYLERVIASARRQVLIEATVVEVELDDAYQAGIDWQILGADPGGVNAEQSLLGSALETPPFFSLSFLDPGNDVAKVGVTLRALEQFGDVQVLSSPKIITLNNQTAILKVVDNRVYFTTHVQVTTALNNTDRSFETTVHTVPVGFVMNVTPFINAVDEVILNIRPSISRILDFVPDPNPALADAGIESLIPEIQVREMESTLRVGSGQTAIIGGLMQDKVDRRRSGVPLLSRLPLLGPVFSYREEQVLKTELIIFLRPLVIEVADVAADLRAFRALLPRRAAGDQPGGEH